MKIIAIIVTYNRKALLEHCLSAIANQTRKPDRILIVDNASTDGTRELLQTGGWVSRTDVELLPLESNTGGAGGFAAGLKYATEIGADWAWMMDDDAEPWPDALEKLMEVAIDPEAIYGSLAISGDQTSWVTTILDDTPWSTRVAAEVPREARVQSLPFLGFLIHRNLVQKIGLPDTGFFIAADDIEYCVRAQQAGAKIVIAGRSRIEHPKSNPYAFKLPGYTLTCLELPPWKRYYDTRNRLLIARRYYGRSLFTQTIPGSFMRLFAALINEPNKWAQFRAFWAGFVDGLAGRTGRRHEEWRIKA